MTANTVIDAMFNVGAHFGYSRARRHASVSPFLFGAKNGVDIIDLTHTAKQLDIARARAEEVAKSGKPVLFVGTKQEIRALVEETALSLNMPYVTERWVGGMLTNWPEIRKRTNRLKELSEKFAKGELDKYTKKEKLLFEREMGRLQAEFGGIASLEGAPGLIVIVDTREEHIAVTEAKKMRVETIGIGNTDCDASKVTYPVVGNDAAILSVSFFLKQIAEAVESGKKARA
jgi:small subunit ribosomal protein S2